jgi:hypothetical protein
MTAGLNQSAGRFPVESVKKQSSAGYEKEIENLKTQLTNNEALSKQNTEGLEKIYQEKLSGLQGCSRNDSRYSTSSWILIRCRSPSSNVKLIWAAIIAAIILLCGGSTCPKSTDP